ncbi:MAG: alpha/beta hydrolase [Flavobacterium sp.]|nr:alpha/beta hydrolase [Flavobacterium sp.]
MKKIILFLLLTFSISGFSQKFRDSILSKKLDKYRELTISLPSSYNRDSKKSYPLLVLLDGDYLFDPFQGALSYGNYWDDLPEVIIVGISQNKANERQEDCGVDPLTGLPDANGSKFFEFVGSELVSYMQQKYRVAPLKIIAGHDYTAGFINFYLYKDDPVFNGYISLSPELPKEMENLLPVRLATFKQNIFYYISSADGDIRKMKDKIKILDDNVKTNKNPSVNYQFDEIKGATHYSLVLHSIPDALYQFFASYQPITTIEFQEKILPLTSGYVDYLTSKYETMQKTLGFKMNIRYNDFKAIEAAILKNKAYNEFEKLSQLSHKMYPKTMLGDYHLAMFYEKTGDLKKAAKMYQNAFQFEPIGELTKDMMLDKAEALKGSIKSASGKPDKNKAPENTETPVQPETPEKK